LNVPNDRISPKSPISQARLPMAAAMATVMLAAMVMGTPVAMAMEIPAVMATVMQAATAMEMPEETATETLAVTGMEMPAVMETETPAVMLAVTVMEVQMVVAQDQLQLLR